MKNRALFLDRDGVVNADTGYVYKAEDIRFIDGIFDLARAAHGLGYKLIIVTNQAGIGRGYYSEDDFHVLMRWMEGEFVAKAAPLDGYYFCPHHPVHGQGEYKRACPCRKPEPGMLLQAMKEHDIDPVRSIMIGDKHSDIEAGLRAGIKTLWQMQSPETGDQPHQAATFVQRLSEIKL